MSAFLEEILKSNRTKFKMQSIICQVKKLELDVIPSARQTFGLCTVNNHIYIFGGETDPDICFSDLWKLDS